MLGTHISNFGKIEVNRRTFTEVFVRKKLSNWKLNSLTHSSIFYLIIVLKQQNQHFSTALEQRLYLTLLGHDLGHSHDLIITFRVGRNVAPKWLKSNSNSFWSIIWQLKWTWMIDYERKWVHTAFKFSCNASKFSWFRFFSLLL